MIINNKGKNKYKWIFDTSSEEKYSKENKFLYWEELINQSSENESQFIVM